MVFNSCVEKNIRLPEGTPGRTFKSLAVDQGSNVKDQDCNWAIFQELQSCPSTMAASKVADLYSLIHGHAGEQTDAEIAYTHAAFTGPEAWVELPKEQRSSSWFVNGRPFYWQPVGKLLEALDPPGLLGGREQRCDSHLRTIGLIGVGNGRSVYFHKELPILLAVCDDVFNMVGPKRTSPPCGK